MKRNLLLIGLATVFALASCGGASEEKTTDEEQDKAPVCEVENGISVTVQDYMYSMSDTLVLNMAEFEVKTSDYKCINDSTVSLKLSNYEVADLVGARTPEQVDINIEINARNGEKLEGGYYGYHAYDTGKWSRVTLTTAYGTVWFNWVSGMPEQGGVTIEYVGEDAICGTLELNNEKPDNDMIGIVRVNGTFVYKETEE
ncbi:MAG: hypothetical protein C0596_17865 [Marinilabiliales bacterium]|nr:MAG: hypothetical protein C0596_17865 [Marinilabiliales bacterium]